MKKKRTVSRGEIALLAAAALFLCALFVLRAADLRALRSELSTERDLPPDPPPAKIDLNRASAEELSTLNGIGEELAERIVRYREENGDFQDVSDVQKVAGIGEKKYESIREDVTVNGGETP